MEYVGTAADSFRGFFEPVEVRVWGDRFVMCTGVRGVAVYQASDTCCASLEATLTPEPSRSYPRCQHVALDGDRLYVSNHGDEILPEPFITIIDGRDLSAARTIETYLGDGQTSFEGLDVHAGALYAAMHDRGVGVFRIEGDGSIELIETLTDRIENAWLPRADPAAGLLHVADGQGGVAVYSISDPLSPVLLAKLPTLGTVKDVAFADGFVYAAAGTAGVEVHDVRDPANPRELGRIDTPGSALGIDTNGRHLVVADWNDVRLFDLSDPAAPRLVGHQNAYDRGGAPTPRGRILDVALRDDDLFMAEWEAAQVHRVVPGAEAPDLLVPSTIELPRTAAGTEATTSITLQNLGSRPVEIRSIAVQPPFFLDTVPEAVDAGARSLATLTFRPTDDSPAEGSVEIESDDPDEPLIHVRVRGNLSGLRPGDQAPDVRLVDLDGFEHHLSDYAGSPVLLAYFATF